MPLTPREEPQDPGQFIVREGSISQSRQNGRLATRSEPYLDGTILAQDGLYIREWDRDLDLSSEVIGILVGNHHAAVAGPKVTYVYGSAEVEPDFLLLSDDPTDRQRQMYGLKLLGITFSTGEVIVESGSEPPSEPVSEPPSEPASEPDNTFIAHPVDLGGVFGVHPSVGGSIEGEVYPGAVLNTLYSLSANQIIASFPSGMTIPILEGLKLVRDGNEASLQGKPTTGGGTVVGFTHDALPNGIAILSTADATFELQPIVRSGPLEVKGRTNGSQVEYENGNTNDNVGKQGAEWNNDHPFYFLRVNPVDSGGYVEMAFWGDTLALLAGKKVTINGEDWVFDDADTSNYNVNRTLQTFYTWLASGPAALTQGTFYSVVIADV